MICNELYHHGVKGQKWGVRRFQNKDGSLTLAGKNRRGNATSPNDKEKINRKNALKKRRTMSVNEMKSRIERLKLEKEFKNLTEENLSPGRKAVKDILASAGTKVLTTVAAGAAAYAVKAAMTKHFDIKEAASYIAANPNKKK